MGVPAFFRWLTKKYPSVIVHCVEDRVMQIDGVKVPFDSTAPNPNGVEFDNLYLDMNGIIHPCTHPENKPAPKNEDEMMIAIFECIDRLFRIVRPRKLLYMAIDGVAPRAKMNQQRSRRFRSTKETAEKLNEIDRVRAELEAKGCLLPPTKERGEHFDSNCITPGTPFMDRLAVALNYYIHERLNTDPAWKNIKIILSDASVPGEGEHKVMDYIRRQRAQPGHDPNTSHCLCGADADLIMLGLATHEPNFTIIREEFRPNRVHPCEICGQDGHEMKDCLGLEKECPPDGPEPPQHVDELEFIFVRINVLREYLQKELNMPNLPFTFNLERAVDDWVFMCFFVGNDFLPHLPSLEIREGAIDRLVRLYKKCVYKTGGWLTEDGVPNLNRVQLILSELGEMEDEIFKNRQNNELRFQARMKSQKRRKFDDANCYGRPSFTPDGSFAPVPLGRNNPSPVHQARNQAYNMRTQGMHTTTDGNIPRSNQDAAAALKAMLTGKESAKDQNSSFSSTESSTASSSSVNLNFITHSHSVSLKRKLDYDNDEEEETNDEVRLWEDGFKDRYYESKFDVLAENIKFRIEVGHQYVKGLCWVLRYYYQGCASWEWYFPYHYAPFASDFLNVGDLPTEFDKTTQPFSPLEQLMGVFPAASRSHVPEPWGRLMMDPNSPLIDFYPEDFQIDLNGKKFAWQGVALLPFVDEVRLKGVLKDHYTKLTQDEVRRNTRGDDRLYVRKGHEGYDFLVGLYENEFEKNTEVAMDPSMFQGIGGKVLVSNEMVSYKGTLKSPIPKNDDVVENQVILVRYRDLKFGIDHVFPAKRLKGAVDLPIVLKPGDLSQEESKNWRPMIGMTHSNQRASLDVSGHRALTSAVGNQSRGSYGNMPPPQTGYGWSNDRQRNSGQYDSRSHHNNSGGGSYGSQRGGNNYSGGGYQGSYGGNRHESGSGYGGNAGGSRGGRDSGYGSYSQHSGGGGGGGGQYGHSNQRSTFGSHDQRNQSRRDDNNQSGRGGGERRSGYFTSGYSGGGGGGGGGGSRY